MKIKYLLIVFIAIVFFFAGCSTEKGAEPETDEQEDFADDVTETDSGFTLNISYVDESENPIDFDKEDFVLKDGRIITASAVNGTSVCENFPAENGISCVLRKGAQTVCMHKLSFWTGYSAAYHNNLDTITIDIPGNIEALFLTVKVDDNGKIRCIAMSETELEESEEDTAKNGKGEIQTQYGSKVVSETGVKLRSEPSTEADVLRKMNFGDPVSLLDSEADAEKQSEWTHVKYEDMEGYISSEYLGRFFTVNKNGVNVRENPSASSRSVNILASGTRVVALNDGETVDGNVWYKVSVRDGTKGYIRSDFLA